MKVKKLLSISAIAILLSCAGKAQESNEGPEWKTYNNEQTGLTLSYPADWDTTDKDPRVAFIAAEYNEDTLDRYNENLNLTIFDAEGKDLNAIIEQNYNAAKAYLGDSVELNKSTLVNRNGVQLGCIRFNMTSKGMELSNASYFFTDGTNIFCLTLGGEQSKDEQYGKIWDSIIQSIKLGKA